MPFTNRLKSKAVSNYLGRYACEETKFADLCCKRYHYCLVAPLKDESIDFFDRLATVAGINNTLVIAVVNNQERDAPELVENNVNLLRTLAGDEIGCLDATGAAIITRKGIDVLLVDRATPGREFPMKQGVGLARKIGMDLALSHWAKGKVHSNFLHMSDGDATLPGNYFSASDQVDGQCTAALHYPFTHVGGDAQTKLAHEMYEFSLRYFVEGLRFAGSPYAFHTVGSCIAVHAKQYAAVRGVPRREAGEDFYLLNKLAKLGKITTPSSQPIELLARKSLRVPFGTGRSTSEYSRLLDRGINPRSYAPTCFKRLRSYLHFSRAHIFNDGATESGTMSAPQLPEELGPYKLILLPPLAKSIGATGSADKDWKRFCDAFDAFKTRMFIHAVRDHEAPDLLLSDIVKQASFLDMTPPIENISWQALCEQLALRQSPGGQHRRLDPQIGVDRLN